MHTKGLGLLVLPPNIILRNPIADAISTHLLHQPLPALGTRGAWGLSGPVSPELAQLCALCGVFSCAISLAYGMSMYHGFDEWIYLSVPGRLAVVLLALVAWVMNRRAMSPLLFTIIVWDGTGALVTGWALGTWNGRRHRVDASKSRKGD